MSSDEEYLDDLLKSFMENEDESNHLTTEEHEDSNDIAEMAEEAAPVAFDAEMEEPAAEENDFAIDDFAIEDFGMEELPIDEPAFEEGEQPENAEGDQELTDELAESELSLNDFAIQEQDIDELSMEDNQQEEEENETEEADSEETDAIDDIGIMSLEEIDEMFAAADDAASSGEEEQTDSENPVDLELAEISDLLQAENNDSADDDMLALLESMSADLEETGQTVSEDSIETAKEVHSDVEMNEKEGDGEVKNKKGIFAKIFGKKNKAEQISEEIPEDSADNEEEPHTAAEDNGDLAEENPVPQKEKKQNFFSKFMSFLTETDEDETDGLTAEHGMEPSDENKNILEELDAEDKKKKKKKVKGKNKEEQSDEDEGDEDAALKDSKKKKKKEKKAKPDTEDILAETKPEKKISKKNIAVIAGLSITLTAVIVVLCSIVPGYFDKRAAREAYYESDYSKSYELLYGKKLDNSDEIIYNKSKIILELNRKLSSYHNYMSMGKEVQALDALMSGIRKYPEIYEEAEEYHVTQEVNVIYETILNILNDKYALSEAVAKVINDYEDDWVYTMKLESIVYGTPFVLPEEESVTTKAVTDILPEEQSLLEEAGQPEQTAEDSGASQAESSGEAVGEETNSIPIEEELPINTGDANGGQEQQAGEEGTAEQTEEETAEQPPAEQEQEAPAPDTSSNSQGQLIQGIRQPIDIEIHGN